MPPHLWYLKVNYSSPSLGVRRCSATVGHCNVATLGKTLQRFARTALVPTLVFACHASPLRWRLPPRPCLHYEKFADPTTDGHRTSQRRVWSRQGPDDRQLIHLHYRRLRDTTAPAACPSGWQLGPFFSYTLLN